MDDYYSVKQVSIILKVHPLTVRRYIRTLNLKAVRVGGAVRVARADLDQFMSEFKPMTRIPKPAVDSSSKFKVFDKYDSIFRLRARGSSV